VATQRSLRLERRPAAAGHPPQAVRRGPDGLGGCWRPRPLRLSSAPFIYPPGSMQRLARGAGTGVQILKLLPRFTMANFKNRLTAAKLQISTERGPPKPSRLTYRGSPLCHSLPPGCLQRGVGLERRPAVAGRPPQAECRWPHRWEGRWSPRPFKPVPLCGSLPLRPLHIPTDIDAETCAWSWNRGPDSETFAAIYYGKF
jgi:hypothetical protein